MVVFHYIICFLHAKLFIKGNGFFICNQVYSDIFFTACYMVRGYHKLFSYALSFIGSIDTKICYVKPIGKVR